MANESLYTPAEKDNLQALWNDLQSKKQKYEEELSYNTQGHTFQQQGNWQFPYKPYSRVDERSFLEWLALSDAALPNKKNVYLAAKADYENEVIRLEKKYEQTLYAQNPTLAATMQENIIKGKNEELAVKLEAENKANYASSTAKYWLWGSLLALSIIGIGVFSYFYQRKTA